MLVGLRPHLSAKAGSEPPRALPPIALPPPLTGPELVLRKVDRLFYGATDTMGLATMVVGGLGFGLGRLGTAGALARFAPRLWQGSPLLGRLAAGLGGLAAESATFSNFPRALRSLQGEAVSWDRQTLLQDFFKTGLLFGMLRTSGLGGSVLVRPWVNTFGAGTAPLVPTVAMGLGIYGNFWVEEKIGWREKVHGEKRLWDSLETLAQFQMAGLALHHFLGRGYENLQNHFERKFWELQSFALGPRRVLASLGPMDMAEGLWYAKESPGDSPENVISEPPSSGIKGGESERVRRPPSSEPPPPESIEFELLPGMKLDKGRYSVLELLDQGGMAEVWLLQDHQLDRTVAGKIALPEHRRNLQHRFEREFLLQAQAHMPREWRAEVYDVLEVKKGLKMLIMEYIPGKDLEHLVLWLRNTFEDASRAYPIERRIQIFADICKGVHATHQMVGLLHRDLKPKNIKLAAGGDSVRILDYGVAAPIREMRNWRPSSSFSATLEESFAGNKTPEGKFVGTPGYYAPEVARMADPKTKGESWVPNYEPPQMDVFSLGVILFELITGHHPLGEYAPGNPELGEPPLIPIRDSRDFTKVLEHRVYDLLEGYIPPPVKDFHPSLDAPIFRRLEKVALKAMSPDLTVRYTSAKELEQAILMVEPEVRYDDIETSKTEIQMIEDKLRQAEPSYRRSKTRTPQESLRLTQLEERARYLKATWVAESERLVSDLLAMAHREDFPAAQHLIAKVSAALFSDGGSRLHPARRKTLMERIQNNDVPYHHYIRPVMARALTEGVPAQVDVHPIHEPLRPIHGLRWTFTRLQQEKDSYGDETGNFVKGPSISIDPQGARPLLGQGYYIFELAAPGYAPMNVPISLSYEKIKSHLESGRSLSFGLEMVPADWVPKDMKVIHHTTGYIGHDFYHDGDTVSAHSFPRRTIEIPTQALTEGPISVGQYIPFIEDLLGQNNALYRHGGREFLARLTEIEALLPRTTIPVGARRTSRRAGKGEDGIQYYWKLEQKRLLGIGPVTQVRLIDPTTHLDPFDDPIHLGQPISAIPLDSGFAFAAWRSKKEGVPYEVADADTLNVVANSSFDTRYPWGNGQITDTYVVSRGTFEDVSRATPQLIGSHPLGPEFYRDSSWYGIRDLIGNIRKSTSTEGEPDHLVLFAGSLRMYPGANFSPASRYQAHRKWAMDSDGAFFLSLKFPKKK